jgi:hypothetical protein
VWSGQSIECYRANETYRKPNSDCKMIVVYKIIMETMTGHFVCGVDSPLNVIGPMKHKENQILTAK